MTKLYMFDAAYQPNLALVKTHGGIAVNGYLTGKYATTTTQPGEARAAGLGWVATYEEDPAELVGASRAVGHRVGDKIVKALRDKGVPIRPDVAVYPSVDVPVAVDGKDRDADACNNAWQGILDVFGRDLSLRAYAEGAVIDALATAGLVGGKCWLAAPTSWPGFNVDDEHICMVQLVGTPVAGTDQNHLVTDPRALGAWWPAGSPYLKPNDPTPTPAPAPPSPRKETDMSMLVIVVDRATVPKGEAWPGYRLLDNGVATHIEPPEGTGKARVDNLQNLLHALNQAAAVPVTYTQYKNWTKQ